MKKVVYILCGVAVTGLLITGSCAGLFFYVKNQEENVMTELLKEKTVLQEYLGAIEQVNVDLTARDKRSPNGELMILSVVGSKTSGTLIYGEIPEGNRIVPVMELKLADGRLIDLNGKLEVMGWGTEDGSASLEADPDDSDSHKQ